MPSFNIVENGVAERGKIRAVAGKQAPKRDAVNYVDSTMLKKERFQLISIN
jgi:hypothetical protein